MSKVNDLKQENEIKIREYLYDGQIWTKNEKSVFIPWTNTLQK